MSESSRNWEYVETYAFLDSGSNSTFCLEDIARSLNVEGKKMNLNLTTMGQQQMKTCCVISGLQICDIDGMNVLELASTRFLVPFYLKIRWLWCTCIEYLNSDLSLVFDRVCGATTRRPVTSALSGRPVWLPRRGTPPRAVTSVCGTCCYPHGVPVYTVSTYNYR